jgi:hypothetical protein
MVDDEQRTRRRPSSSQRAILAQEYNERTRYLTYAQYFGRLVYIGILLTVGIEGAEDARFRLAAAFSAGLFGFFCLLDSVRQTNQLRRLSMIIANFEEKTSPQYWEDNFIRYEYGLKYSIQERYLGQFQLIEPLVWMVCVVFLIYGKILS